MLPRLLGAASAAAAVTYVFVVGFPAERFAIDAGLDASWTYGINLAAEQGLIFGRDVVFTYGPFGYLRSPVPLASNLPKAVAFQLGLHLALCVLLLSIAVKTRRPQALVIWAVGYAAALALGLSYEYQMVGVAILLACASIQLFRSRWMLLASGALSAVLFFIRPGAGLLVLTTTAALILFAWPAGRKWLWTAAYLSAAGLVAISLLVGIARFGSIESFATWLRLSAELMGGFDVAMSAEGPGAQIIVALVAAGVFLAPAIRAPSQHARLTLALLPAVFLGFKHTFVRQDLEHVFTIFFGFLLLLAASIQLFLERPKERWTAVAVMVSIALLGLGLQKYAGLFSRGALTDVFTAQQGVRKLTDTLALKSQLAAFDRLSAHSLSQDRLPPRWIEVIARESGTAMPFPTEISYCAANPLRCRMYPALQAYSAYTGVLDQWSASIFESVRAPDFVVAEFASIDRRNVWFDVPLTWRSLLAHYRLVDSEDGRRLLLGKRAQPAAIRPVPIGRTTERFGKWIALPPHQNMTWIIGSPRLNLTWLGSWRKALYKIEAVELEVRYRSGESARWRFVPSTAQQGLLLSAAPRSGRELADIFSGGPVEAVTDFRIVGPGAVSFEQEFQVDWWATVASELEKNGPKE
jgi:hypothetical protein